MGKAKRPEAGAQEGHRQGAGAFVAQEQQLSEGVNECLTGPDVGPRPGRTTAGA